MLQFQTIYDQLILQLIILYSGSINLYDWPVCRLYSIFDQNKLRKLWFRGLPLIVERVWPDLSRQDMFSNSTNNRLLSAALLDQEQLEETQRLQRLGETQRRSVSALLLPSSTRCQSAPDPVTEGFFGSKLFGRLMSRQSSSRRSEGESLVSQFGLLDVEQRVSSRQWSYYRMAKIKSAGSA